MSFCRFDFSAQKKLQEDVSPLEALDFHSANIFAASHISSFDMSFSLEVSEILTLLPMTGSGNSRVHFVPLIAFTLAILFLKLIA